MENLLIIREAKSFLVKVTLVLVTLSFLLLTNRTINTWGLTKSEFDAQTAEINANISRIEENLAPLLINLENTQAEITSLQAQVESINQDIQNTEEAIVLINDTIAKLESQIAFLADELERLIQERKDITRKLQIENSQSLLEVILTSRNISDAISSIYNLSTAEDTLTRLELENLELTEQIQEAKTKNKQAKTQLEETQYLLDSKKATLEYLLVTYQGKEVQYVADLESRNAEIAELNAKAEELQQSFEVSEEARKRAEEAAKQKQQNPGGGGSSGGTGGGSGYIPTNCRFEETNNPGIPGGYFIRPTAGIISQGFHCGHDAVDIAAGAGTPILASASGVIENKGSYNVAGYGHWVMIKHVLPNGNRVYTLYAHLLSSAPVSVGQFISQGQQIGSMGCTGLCFGTHLHFVIYSSSYESTGLGCNWGSSKCYNPYRFVPL